MKRVLRASLIPLLFTLAVSAFAQGPSEDELRGRVLAAAAKYKGTPYMYGAESPSAFDCSGFVRWVYREATGLELPRSAKDIFAAGVPIPAKTAKPGDVFVYDTVGGSPSHVAIYLGDGSVIHAVSEGPHTGVIVSSATDSYFPPRLIAARSFLGAVVAASQVLPAGTSAAASGSKPAAAAASIDAPEGPAKKPEAAKSKTAPVKVEAPVVDIGFSISSKPASFTDRIPAATGTEIAFALTNDTGEDGTFIVVFYKVSADFSGSKEIHRERANIKAGKYLELPAYRFAEAGVYKLIVKDTWNTQLMERVFTVESPAK